MLPDDIVDKIYEEKHKMEMKFIEECKKELAEIKELMKIYKEITKKLYGYKKFVYVGKITPEYNFWEDFLGLFGYKCEDRDVENSDNSRTYLKDGSYIRTYDIYYQSNDPNWKKKKRNTDPTSRYFNPDYIVCEYKFFNN